MLSLLSMIVLLSAIGVWLGICCWRETTKLVQSNRQLKSSVEDIDVQQAKVIDACVALDKRLESLARDVLNRDVYKGSSSSHRKAIAAARKGSSVDALREAYGLTMDEAELLKDLHASGPLGGGPQTGIVVTEVKPSGDRRTDDRQRGGADEALPSSEGC